MILGSVLHLMNGESVLKVLDILLSLLTQTPWEARHGGLLGLKYMLAVKQVRFLLEIQKLASNNQNF